MCIRILGKHPQYELEGRQLLVSEYPTTLEFILRVFTKERNVHLRKAAINFTHEISRSIVMDGMIERCTERGVEQRQILP